MSERSRKTPPLWLWFLWLLIALGILWHWMGDPGDEGIRNVMTGILALLGVLLGFLWFVFLSGHPGRRRAAWVWPPY